MQDSDIPDLFGVPFAQAAGIYKRVIPVPSQVGVQDGAASFTTGFVPLNFIPTDSGGVPPYGTDMNGILYNADFSAAIGGYPKYAILNKVGATALWWISTVDNNTSDPDAGGANWSPFPISSVVAARTVTHGGAFTLSLNDSYVALDRTSSPGASSTALPSSPPNGKQITIQDLRGDLVQYNCTVSPSPGDTIARLTSFVMNIDRQSCTFTFYSDASQWSIE